MESQDYPDWKELHEVMESLRLEETFGRDLHEIMKSPRLRRPS